MVEYLYNAIRATAGQEITIAANVTDESGVTIDNGCCLMFHGDNDKTVSVNGEYVETLDLWTFTIEPEITEGLKGRYWYCIQRNGANLCFKEPIYLV